MTPNEIAEMRALLTSEEGKDELWLRLPFIKKGPWRDYLLEHLGPLPKVKESNTVTLQGPPIILNRGIYELRAEALFAGVGDPSEEYLLQMVANRSVILDVQQSLSYPAPGIIFRMNDSTVACSTEPTEVRLVMTMPKDATLCESMITERQFGDPTGMIRGHTWSRS